MKAGEGKGAEAWITYRKVGNEGLQARLCVDLFGVADLVLCCVVFCAVIGNECVLSSLFS